MSISDKEFSDLYETSKGAVDFVLYKVEHDDALREDLVQEVFTAAWASRDSFAGAAQLKTWLMGVAKNIGRKYIRDEIINAPDLTYEHKFRSYEMDSEYEDDEYVLQAHELQFGMDLSDPAAEVEFEQELERLSDSQQRAMELRLFGFTQEEIAIDMGISQQMVSKLLTSARDQLMEG